MFSGNKKYYRTAELAEYLGVSKSTLYRYVSLGKLPKPKKLSSYVSVYNIKEVEEYLNNINVK